MAASWASYDSAAQCHDRLAGPSFFEQPARDLVAAIDVGSAASILDIGTGSGLAALQAARIADPHAMVVGIDPSVEMLRTARSRGVRHVVAGVAPDLPFTDSVFDVAVASFVLSHLSSYEVGLREIARVLKPAGRLGVTTWGAIQDEYRNFWQSLAERFIDKAHLAEATREALPWEEWFTDPENLDQAFQAAGLRDVRVQRAEYTIHTNIADFLAIREVSLQARFMRQNLDAAQWEGFRETVAAEFYRQFRDPIDHPRDVYIAIGTKRSAS